MQHQTKTAVVLGANGFLGNAVAVGLSREGYKVYGVIRDVKHSSRLALQEIIPVVGTLTEISWADKIGPVDVVVNCTQDVKQLETWVGALHNIVTKFSKDHGKKPLFIFTSGMTVFGDTGRPGEEGFHKINEESPLNPLPISKFRGPIIEKLFENENFHTAIVIPGMIYGKGQSLYGIYLGQAAKGNTIVAQGKSNVVWHGVHVDDVADVFVRVANAGEKAHKQSYLAANDTFETKDDILKAISKHFGGNHEISYVESKGDAIGMFESTSIAIDNGKIKRELGWRQRRPNFIDSLEQNIVSWKAHQEAHGDAGAHH